MKKIYVSEIIIILNLTQIIRFYILVVDCGEGGWEIVWLGVTCDISGIITLSIYNHPLHYHCTSITLLKGSFIYPKYKYVAFTTNIIFGNLFYMVYETSIFVRFELNVRVLFCVKYCNFKGSVTQLQVLQISVKFCRGLLAEIRRHTISFCCLFFVKIVCTDTFRRKFKRCVIAILDCYHEWSSHVTMPYILRPPRYFANVWCYLWCNYQLFWFQGEQINSLVIINFQKIFVLVNVSCLRVKASSKVLKYYNLCLNTLASALFNLSLISVIHILFHYIVTRSWTTLERREEQIERNW